MTNPYWNTLISAADLHEHLHDAHLVIVDCRFELGNPTSGHTAYQQAHIPGAQYAHLDQDLSGPINSHSGRHPLPDTHHLTETFSRWGINGSKQVIAYDAGNGAMAAARLWWLLRWLGHTHVAVLDGGLKQWLAAGFELSSSVFTPVLCEFKARVHDEMTVSSEQVAARVAQTGWRLLDARAADRYAGETEPLDPVAGHIPGARNYPFTRNLDADARFLPATQLRQQYQQSLGNASAHQTMVMCGSGVTACHNLLAMEIAGLRESKLYAGSWSEWCKAHNRPVAVGRDEHAA